MRRLRKTVSRRPLPAFIDLIDWLKTRGYADTTGQATRLMVGGKVRADSHIIGRERVKFLFKGKYVERWEPVAYVPASLRNAIRVDS